MRKGNVTILASIFMMLLVAMGVGAGTMAYFSDVETSIGNYAEAGTLDIEIQDGDEGYFDGAPVHASVASPSGGLKPGDTFWSDTIKLRNKGSIDAQYVYLSVRNLACHEGVNPESEWPGSPNYIATKVILLEIQEYSPLMGGTGGWYTNDFSVAATCTTWLTYWGAPDDGSISLWDIVQYGEPAGASAETSFRFHTGDGGDPPYHTVYPYLPVGGVVQMKFKFKLLEDTDNRAQGDWVGFDLYFFASNCLSGTDLDASI